MNTMITEVLASTLSAKKKAKAIASALLDGSLASKAVLQAGPTLADAEYAIVMEALEETI